MAAAGFPVTKAHAYGNDFLFIPADRVSGDPSALARTLCHRHHGVGADGLIAYTLRAGGATMKLWNADGSASELSGNGLRCLAALVARQDRLEQRHWVSDEHPRTLGVVISVDTTAGVKTLELLERDGERYRFRAAMGAPEGIRAVTIPIGAESISATILSVGNPQCIVLGPLPDERRFTALGPQLSTHAMFPAGTNVEFVEVERPDRIRILIWERGVGPTTSSGTGASASAVAAAAHGGASRDVDVVAPGGTQRVEWREDAVYLTGWAEILFDANWVGKLI